MAKKKSYTFDEVIEWAGTQSKLQALMYPGNPGGSNVKIFKMRGGFTTQAAIKLEEISGRKFTLKNVPTTGWKLTKEMKND